MRERTASDDDCTMMPDEKLHNHTLVTAISVGILGLLLLGCEAKDTVLPPLAKVGDTTLAVRINAVNGARLSNGSRIVISINHTVPGGGVQTVAGDVVDMTQSDSSVRVSIPLDKAAVVPCAEVNRCGVWVQVVKGKQVISLSRQAAPYRTGQKAVTVNVVPGTGVPG